MPLSSPMLALINFKAQWSHWQATAATSASDPLRNAQLCYNALSLRRRANLFKYLKLLLWITLVLLTSACDTLQFYQQAVSGQLQILRARVPVSQVLEASTTDAVTRERLQTAAQIVVFAQDTLGIAADGRYSSYVGLDREYVVWNVFAAAPYDLNGEQWCYPIVGCAPYRGFFDLQNAQAVAQRYRQAGMETYVGGVPAYSTLGYFDDPLLSTFINWPDADLANLLMHELAHSKVWVNSDVAFNESFAEFVGQQGAKTWLFSRGEGREWLQWQAERRAWRTFRDFVVMAKSKLQAAYEREDAETAKMHTVSALQACYQTNRADMGEGRFDALMAENFNNAFLISISTYANHLSAFRQVFLDSQADWPLFFSQVQTLADLSSQERQDQLVELSKQQIAHGGDDDHTKQINCQSFFGHGGN